MKGFLIKSFVCVAICLYFSSIVMASTAIFSNLIVFGDSLSDAASLSSEPYMSKEKNRGNNYWAKTLGKIGAPVTSLNSVSQVSLLWPNELVNDANLFDENPNHTRYIYPSSQAHLLGFSPSHYSIDYAWASAETGNDYLNDLNLHEKTSPSYLFPSYDTDLCLSSGPGYITPQRSCIPGVVLQVKQYLNDVHQHPNPNTLFILWAGGNDIFNNAAKIADKNAHENHVLLLLKMLNTAYPLFSNMGNAPLSSPIRNIKQAVVLLIQAGVSPKNIYVINLPDLAETPAAQLIAQGQKSVLYLWRGISIIFNVTLQADLVFDYLHPTFNLPKQNIISADAMLKELLKNEKKYGFSKGSQSCVGNKATPYCQGYIFFDDKHPTTAVHEWMGQRLMEILGARK